MTLATLTPGARRSAVPADAPLHEERPWGA